MIYDIAYFGDDDIGYNSDRGATKKGVWGKRVLNNEESEMGVAKNADENNSVATGSSGGKGERTTLIESAVSSMPLPVILRIFWNEFKTFQQRTFPVMLLLAG